MAYERGVKMMRLILFAVLAAVTAVAATVSAPAQTFLFKGVPSTEPTIRVRWLRPYLANDAELSTLSGVYDFYVNLPISNEWSIDGDLPFVTYSVGDEDSENFIANVYAGMQYLDSKPGRTRVGSFGVWIPTAEEDLGMTLFGVLTNGEKPWKYLPNTLTVTGNYGCIRVTQGGARLGFELGPDLLIPTGDNEGDTEFFAHYGLTAGYQGESFLAMTELIGAVQFTGEADEFSDRFLHSINFGASYLSRHFKPGVFYKLYLKEDFSDLVDGVLGVNLEIVL
jgi:hypothetical protein